MPTLTYTFHSLTPTLSLSLFPLSLILLTPSLSLFSPSSLTHPQPPPHHGSIQLAVDVSIPELLGGVGGEAIYIGTPYHTHVVINTHITSSISNAVYSGSGV